jgi:hypothetical protein
MVHIFVFVYFLNVTAASLLLSSYKAIEPPNANF